MKPFLILQLRPETDASDNEYASILDKCGLSPDQTKRIRMDREDIPADLKVTDYAGVIVGGGPGCVSDDPATKHPVEARAEAEELGGADLHCRISGVSDHMAEDERHALHLARNIVENIALPRKADVPMARPEEPAYDPAELDGSPASFKSIDAKGPQFQGKVFTVQVAPEDCTGCEVCVHSCPAHVKDADGNRTEEKAIMRLQEDNCLNLLP